MMTYGRKECMTHNHGLSFGVKGAPILPVSQETEMNHLVHSSENEEFSSFL